MSAPFAGVASRLARLPADVRDALRTPGLLVDLDAARRNVGRVLALCGGDPDRWRPHLKTTKSPAVWELLVDAGVRRYKVATTREFEVLADLLVRRRVTADILFAQGATPPAAARIAGQLGHEPNVTGAVLIEDERQLDWVPDALDVFVDVNPGGDRTGIQLERVERIVEVARAAGGRLRGLHSYEGHLHAPFPARGEAIDAVFEGLREALGALRSASIEVGEVVTSGTPAFRHVLDTRPLAGAPGRPHHTVSAGTVVFHDLRSELENPELGLEPAAVVLARVVSRPRPGRITVDAGSKAVAAEVEDPIAVVLGRPELVGAPCNEEHLPFDAPDGVELPELGELVELVPRHVCPTVNLHATFLAVDTDQVRTVELEGAGHERLLDLAVAPTSRST